MAILPEDSQNKIDALEYGYEWRRCLIWLATQAGLCQDAAIMAVYNDMLQDQRIIAYYNAFPEFKRQIQRIIIKPKDFE